MHKKQRGGTGLDWVWLRLIFFCGGLEQLPMSFILIFKINDFHSEEKSAADTIFVENNWSKLS